MIRENELIISLCHCCKTDTDIKTNPFPNSQTPCSRYILPSEYRRAVNSGLCKSISWWRCWAQKPMSITLVLFPFSWPSHLGWFWLQNQGSISCYPNIQDTVLTHTEESLNNPDDSRLIYGIVITSQNIKFFKDENEQCWKQRKKERLQVTPHLWKSGFSQDLRPNRVTKTKYCQM